MTTIAVVIMNFALRALLFCGLILVCAIIELGTCLKLIIFVKKH